MNYFLIGLCLGQLLLSYLEGSNEQNYLYGLKKNELITWKKEADKAAIERSFFFSGNSTELLSGPFPLTSLHNNSNHLIGIVEENCWIKKNSTHYFLEPIYETIHLVKNGASFSQESPKVILESHNLLSDGAPWPPAHIEFFIDDEKASYLVASFAIDPENDHNFFIRSLACQTFPLSEKTSLTDAPIPLIATETDQAFIAWNENAFFIKLHCHNRLFSKNYSIHWESPTEFKVCFRLLLAPYLPMIEAPSQNKAPKRKQRAKFPLITRYLSRDKITVPAKEFVEEFAWQNPAATGHHTYLEYDFFDGPVVNRASSSKGYTRNPKIPEAVWEKLKPYFLPENHPIKGRLDKLFKKRVIKNSESLKKAGFLTPKPRPFSHSIVSEHKKIWGVIFKMYTDEQNINESRLLLKRILGARATIKEIKALGWDSIFLVPSKWIYPLPATKDSGPFEKHFILIANKMEVFTGEKNRAAWREHVTNEQLRGVYSIVTKVGLSDSLIPSNIPFAKHKSYKIMIVIDTEHWNKWPIPYHKIVPYLNQNKQLVWNQLVTEEKITAR